MATLLVAYWCTATDGHFNGSMVSFSFRSISQHSWLFRITKNSKHYGGSQPEQKGAAECVRQQFQHVCNAESLSGLTKAHEPSKDTSKSTRRLTETFYKTASPVVRRSHA